MQSMVPLYGFGGGGGAGGTLTVTAPAGCTVTVSRDGKSKTKTADSGGLAVFTGLSGGEWTVTITDGSQTAQKTVTITTDYETAITFFTATIHITYPAGSTCTVTDGVTTFTHSDTSGTWECVVPNAGTWTITAVNGDESDSKDVVITTYGQTETVKLDYYAELYDNGNQVESVTGGWVIKNASAYAVCSHESDHIYLGYTLESSLQANIYTKNKITFPYENYTTLKMLISVDEMYRSGSSAIGLTTSPQINGAIGYAYIKNFTSTGENQEISLDISSATGDYYVSIYSIAKSGKIHKIWME